MTAKKLSFNRTVCPLGRRAIRRYSRPLLVTVRHGDDVTTAAVATKEFKQKPGTAGPSLGWCSAEKITLPLNGVPVTVQLQVIMTIIGSNNLPPEETENEEE